MKFKSFLAAATVMLVSLASCVSMDNPAIDSDEAGSQVITATEVANLTPGFIASVSGIEAGQKFVPGSTMTLTLKPGDMLWGGFVDYHAEHIHVHVGDKVYMPEFPADAESDGYAEELKLTVPVPAKPFAVVVAYAVQQQLDANGFTMRLEDNADGVQLYGVSPEQKYKYFDCYLRVPEAYSIDQVEFKMGDGEWQSLAETFGCSFERSYEVDNVYQVTVRPDWENVTGDVLLRVSGTQHNRSKITWKNTEYINLDVPEGWEPNILPESAVGGETVIAQFYTKDGYYLADATANVDGVVPQCYYRAYVMFTMPDQDVEITLDFKEKIPVSSELGSHISKAQLYDNPDLYYGVPTDKAIPGEYVYLFANAEKGYKPLKAVTDKGEESNFIIYGEGLDTYGYYAKVHVAEGATAMSVRAEAVAAYQVSGENIAIDGGNSFAAGETVTFAVGVPAGQQLDGVTAKAQDGTSVAVTMDGTHGSFTMPAQNVTLTATFKKIDPSTQATIKAIYDEDEYRVYSQSEAYWGTITSEGITVPAGTVLYINVQDDYGMPFWVSVKIGDDVQYYQAQEDEDTGEYTFGRSFSFTTNSVIKVGGSRSSVEQ